VSFISAMMRCLQFHGIDELGHREAARGGVQIGRPRVYVVGAALGPRGISISALFQAFHLRLERNHRINVRWGFEKLQKMLIFLDVIFWRLPTNSCQSSGRQNRRDDLIHIDIFCFSDHDTSRLLPP